MIGDWGTMKGRFVPKSNRYVPMASPRLVCRRRCHRTAGMTRWRKRVALPVSASKRPSRRAPCVGAPAPLSGPSSTPFLRPRWRRGLVHQVGESLSGPVLDLEDRRFGACQRLAGNFGEFSARLVHVPFDASLVRVVEVAVIAAAGTSDAADVHLGLGRVHHEVALSHLACEAVQRACPGREGARSRLLVMGHEALPVLSACAALL